MATFTSHSPEETEAIGRRLADLARPGVVFGLVGDLGAGKTRLAHGIARGLGIRGRITSPTFALVHEYPDGRLPLAHLDLYRLDSTDQIHAAGLDDYLPLRNGVAIVEWYERWTGPHPTDLIRISMRSAGETSRHIEITSSSHHALPGD